MDFYRWVRTQWDRATALVAFVVGIIVLLLGWRGTSNATLPTEQIPYVVSGGILGLFALGVAATLWLSADLRDEWRKLDEIHRDIRSGGASEARAGGDSVHAASFDTGSFAAGSLDAGSLDTGSYDAASYDTGQFPAVHGTGDELSGRASRSGDSWQ